MKKFDFARFANFLKWHIVTHKSEIIRMTGYATIVLFLIIRFIGIGTFVTSDGAAEGDLETPFFLGVFYFILGICMCVASSAIFKDLNRKGGFIEFSMAPASHIEKYLTLVIYCTVLPFLSVLLSYFLGEIINVLLFLIEGKVVHGIFTWTIITDMVKSFFSISRTGGNTTELYVMSLFVLGGSFFRKMPFISTSAVILALFVFVTPMISNIMFEQFAEEDDIMNYINGNRDSLIRLGLITDAVLGVLALVNYYISYRLYRRMQVINNKWINI